MRLPIWKAKFSFIEEGIADWPNSNETRKPSTDQSNETEFEPIEKVRAINNIRTEPEPVYHKWADGKEYKLLRQPKNDEYFDTDLPTNDMPVRMKPKMLYANIPRHKTRSMNDIFWDIITDLNPDIWFVTEMFLDTAKNAYIPSSHEIFTHPKLTEKNTIIVTKRSLEATFKLNKCHFNETDVTMITNTGEKTHFLVLYRSPSPRAKVYAKLGYDMNDDPRKRHLHWLNNRISKFLSRPDPALVIGDLNVDLERARPTASDRFAMENWRSLFEQYYDLFGSDYTYISRNGTKSHIDYAILLTAVPKTSKIR